MLIFLQISTQFNSTPKFNIVRRQMLEHLYYDNKLAPVIGVHVQSTIVRQLSIVPVRIRSDPLGSANFRLPGSVKNFTDPDPAHSSEYHVYFFPFVTSSLYLHC